MAVQTTYPDNIRAGLPGQKANMEPAVIASRTVETVAGIDFGKAVAQGTNDLGVKLFGSGDTAIFGIAVRQRSLDANTPTKYAQYDEAGIMTKGCIYVTSAVAVSAAGLPVYVRPSNGDFQTTNANSAVQIANARWETTPGIGEVGVIRLG